MRHGRKSSSRRFDGHKLHVLEDETTEIILGVDVGAGYGKDGDHAALLIEASPGGEGTGAKMIAKVPPTQ